MVTNEAEAKCTYVKGYYRKDGTYVSGYYRGCGSNNSSTGTQNNKEGVSPSKLIINLYRGTQLEGAINTNELVFVEGYYRKDGIFVRPHFRTHPNNFIQDNFSYKGISTLLPLTENQILFSTDSKVATAERYLYSVVGKKKMNSIQIKELGKYAKLLSNSSVSTQKKVISAGKNFYEKFMFNPTFAEKQANFDITGTLTIEDYIYQTLIQLGITNPSSYDQFSLDNYIKELVNLNNGIGYTNQFQNTAKFFYMYHLGLSEQEAIKQVEMDLLQIGKKLKAPTSSDLTEEIEKYLTEKAKSFDMNEFTYIQEISMKLYALDLDYLRKYPQYDWTLRFAREQGLKYYQELGLNDEDANQQIDADINWIMEK